MKTVNKIKSNNGKGSGLMQIIILAAAIVAAIVMRKRIKETIVSILKLRKE